MRNALTPLALLIAVCSVAQPFERVEVVKVDSTQSAADLYRTAERWFVDTFKDAQEVIQLRDTVTHTIVGKGAQRVYFVTTGMAAQSIPFLFTFTLEVATKEGRYRYRFYDGSVQTLDPRTPSYPPAPFVNAPCCYGDCSYAGFGKKLTENFQHGHLTMCQDIHTVIDDIMTSLGAAMSKPKDDW